MILPAGDPATWGPSLDAAVEAIARGKLVVLPTDTVYGVGCDAFNPAAVSAVLAAKGRGRQVPPPVLIASAGDLPRLASLIPPVADALVGAFWPGPLTLVVTARPELAWDLGETNGTVALRVPNHPTALALLKRTGPLAVTSANRTGQAAATTAAEAETALGHAVAVILDAGASPLGAASTIVDVSGERPRVLRMGAVSIADLEAVTGRGTIDEGVAA